jgi:hypothetical protein
VRLRPVGASALVIVGVVISWNVGLLLGRVPLDYLGDEAARLLFSYDASSPRDLFDVLMSRESWTSIHPPGDTVFKGVLNLIAQPFLDRPSSFVLLHQIGAWASTVGGVSLLAAGAYRRWGPQPGVVVAGLAIAGSPIAYVAHHAVGEAFAVLLVGAGSVFVLTRRQWTVGAAALVALPFAAAGVVRPEAAVVFSALAIVPLVERHWKASAVLLAVSISPVVLATGLIELTSSEESYASIRRFPTVGIVDVVTDVRMREIIWGLGVFPYLGVLIMVGAFVRLTRGGVGVGALLGIAWVLFAAVFTLQISVGAVHQQERAYVFPALLGAVAAGALLENVNWSGHRLVRLVPALVAVAVLYNGWTVWDTMYPRWESRVPDDAREVASVLNDRSGRDDAVLLDWMWWQEWRVAVYSSEPGLPGGYCNYSNCPRPSDSRLLRVLGADGLDADGQERLVAAAGFLREERPRHIVRFTDERYEEWLTWRRSQAPLPSFVGPLLVGDGSCVRTLEVLGGDRYCTLLENDSYIVFERQDPEPAAEP